MSFPCSRSCAGLSSKLKGKPKLLLWLVKCSRPPLRSHTLPVFLSLLSRCMVFLNFLEHFKHAASGPAFLSFPSEFLALLPHFVQVSVQMSPPQRGFLSSLSFSISLPCLVFLYRAALH